MPLAKNSPGWRYSPQSANHGIIEDLINADPLVRADAAVFHFFQSLRSDCIDQVMVAITELGDGALAAVDPLCGPQVDPTTSRHRLEHDGSVSHLIPPRRSSAAACSPHTTQSFDPFGGCQRRETGPPPVRPPGARNGTPREPRFRKADPPRAGGGRSSK